MAVFLPGVANTPLGTVGHRLNLAEGMQNGFLRDPVHYTAGEIYVKRNIIAVLITPPGFFEYLADYYPSVTVDDWKNSLRSLVETAPTEISGFSSKISVNTEETKVGHAGEVHESPTNSERERCKPKFTWPEKAGRAVFNFLSDYITIGVQDPDATNPLVVSLQPYIAAGSPPLTSAMRGFTMLFYEPDITLTRINNAVLCTNMWFKDTGENEFGRKMAEGLEAVTIDVECTALSLRNRVVDTMAHAHLNGAINGDKIATKLTPLMLKTYGMYTVANADETGGAVSDIDINAINNTAAASGAAKSLIDSLKLKK
jgi:hypothetical protein